MTQEIQKKKQRAWQKMSKGAPQEALKQLLKIAPKCSGDAELMYMLGCCYAQLKNWPKAQASLEKSIAINSSVPQSYFSLAGVQIATRQYDEALSSLETVLSLNPKMADAHVAMGNVYIKKSDLELAGEHFDKALEIDERCSDACLGLGELEVEAGRQQAALDWFERALRLNSKSVPALCAVANALSNLKRKEEAGGYYRKALKLDKNCVEAKCSLAKLHSYNAEYEKALKLIEPLIRQGVVHTTLAVAFGQCCQYSGRCDEALDYIGKVLGRSGLGASEVKELNFTAGKILDRAGRYDEAFRHYKAANDAVTHIYDSVANTQNVSNIIEVFSPGLFLRAPVSQVHGKHPVFIVGMPRSGTTLTEQILAAHSHVYAAGELEALFDIVRNKAVSSAPEARYPFYVDKLSQQDVDVMAEQYLEVLASRSGSESYVTDKMPHNFYLLGLVQLLFPDARVIHCTRDPLDTCLSIYFQDFADVHVYAKRLFDIGLHYTQYKRLMTHWKNVLSLPVMDVCYEDIVHDQEATTRRILDFCGLGWEDACMAFHKVERVVDTASFDQVRQPLYDKSVGRWRQYEEYLDELKEGLARDY